MPSVVDLIGDSVINRKGETVPTASFCEEGKVIGLYFAAQFDESSVAFTPLLVQFYERIRTTQQGRGFEIVFLSSDKDDESFLDYLKDMPWHAVPFASVEIVERNAKRYKIREMPALVLIEGSTGTLITANGRDCLSEDLDGIEFPWRQKPFEEIISGNLLSHDSSVESKAALSGKVKGIYFSAHWCPPCRMFTPQLVAVYNRLLSEGKNFEVVFVSSDRSQTSFTDYFKTMPWLALPYKDPRVHCLTKRYEVGGIPTLIILDEQNELITMNGRQAMLKDPEGIDFPWFPPSVQELSESNASTLNESPCLILFTDGDEELICKAKGLLPAVANQYINEYKESIDTTNELPDLRFFYEGPESDEIADSIRTFAHLDGRKPLLTIVDIGDRKTYTVQDSSDITRESIDDLIQKFKNSSLEYVPLCD